jgi:cation diffusion facilitator CzcD-associated flavoprotein CzcO
MTGNINRYAGVACDIPAHTYQYTFADNTQWSKFYAGGDEIHKYLLRVTDHYGLRPLIKLQHEIVEARWDGTRWNLKIKNLATGEDVDDTCDFIYYSPGLLSNPVWPKIPGREAYTGIIHHSGNWDAAQEEADGMDWSNKTVGVIGVGSSAIQIVPEMQRKCKKLFTFGRSKSE